MWMSRWKVDMRRLRGSASHIAEARWPRYRRAWDNCGKDQSSTSLLCPIQADQRSSWRNHPRTRYHAGHDQQFFCHDHSSQALKVSCRHSAHRISSVSLFIHISIINFEGRIKFLKAHSFSTARPAAPSPSDLPLSVHPALSSDCRPSSDSLPLTAIIALFGPASPRPHHFFHP